MNDPCPKHMLSVGLFLASLALPMAGHAQACSLHGIVRSAAGTPVPNVGVSVSSAQGGRLQTTRTDNAGRYLVQGPCHPATPYYVEVYWGRELVFRAQQRLESGQTVERDITLPR